MPKDYSRSSRVSEQIRRELAELLRLEVKDPRIGFITLTDVEITPDYAHAKVFFTTLKGEEGVEEVLQGLKSANGFLRREIGRRVRIHTTPELHFVYDKSLERGIHISSLIDKAIASESQHKHSDQEEQTSGDSEE